MSEAYEELIEALRPVLEELGLVEKQLTKEDIERINNEKWIDKPLMEEEEVTNMLEDKDCKHCKPIKLDINGVEYGYDIYPINFPISMYIYFTNNKAFLHDTAKHVARIYYCPMCGRKLDEEE